MSNMESAKIPEISEYGSVDPAPPEQNGKLVNWRQTLLDEEEKCFRGCELFFHYAMKDLMKQC